MFLQILDVEHPDHRDRGRWARVITPAIVSSSPGEYSVRLHLLQREAMISCCLNGALSQNNNDTSNVFPVKGRDCTTRRFCGERQYVPLPLQCTRGTRRVFGIRPWSLKQRERREDTSTHTNPTAKRHDHQYPNT